MTDDERRPIARPGHAIDNDDYEMVLKLAPIAHNSGVYGTMNVEQAAMIMFEGRTIGFNYIASLKHIKYIMGRMQLSAEGILALMHTSQLIDIIEYETYFDDEGIATHCTIEMRRRDSGFTVRRTFTIDMARRAQLVKPDSNWAKWLQNMLEWRCLTWVARLLCPDLMSGLIPYFELQSRGEPPNAITIVEQQGQKIAIVKQLPEDCDHVAMHPQDAACPSCGWPNPSAVVDMEAYMKP